MELPQCGGSSHFLLIELRPVDVSGWTAQDTNYFVPLLETTAEHFELGDVLADKVYLSRKNFKAVEAAGGMWRGSHSSSI